MPDPERHTDLTTDAELAALTRTLHPRLVGLLALHTGDRHVAEDLAQETLIRLHQHWPTVRHHESPTAWACRVAINLSSSWWRRRGAERRANQRVLGRPEPPPTDPADVLAVRAAVHALPLRQRSVVVLRFYQGLSVRETASALRCPEGTVKSLTSQAVAALRRSLTDLSDLSDLSVPAGPPAPGRAGGATRLETFHA